MIIQDHVNKIKQQNDLTDVVTVSYNEKGEILEPSTFRRLFLVILIVLVSMLSFGLGRLSSYDQKQGIKIEYDPALTQNNQGASAVTSLDTKPDSNTASNPTSSSATVTSEEVVGSVKGTKYHYLHCSGAKQISSANKITFKNPTLAEAAGYTLALNCKPR